MFDKAKNIKIIQNLSILQCVILNDFFARLDGPVIFGVKIFFSACQHLSTG